MFEIQARQLADKVIVSSLDLKAGQRLLIDTDGQTSELAAALIEAAYRAGAYPFIRVVPYRLLKEMMRGANRLQWLTWCKHESYRLKSMDAYVGIVHDCNLFELSDLPQEQVETYYKYGYQPLLTAFSELPRWTLIHYPSHALAQSAQISSSRLAQMFDRACRQEAVSIRQAADAWARLLTRTDQVRIVAPMTDLIFSIRGQRHAVCDGKHNLPGGEIYTAPIRSSVEGTIAFNVPFRAMGRTFHDVRLVFRNGKVVDAACNNTQAFQQILQSDEGASRIGEFGIGLNPALQIPVGVPAYDEKMFGSIHLALGQSYRHAGNGNDSTVHMDLVLSLNSADGGGCIYFDNDLVMENGRFTHPQLQPFSR